MDDMLERAFAREKPQRFPAINYLSKGYDTVVTAEIPGVDPRGINISVEGKTLTISGERNPEELREGETCHRRERWQGRFKRSVELPYDIEGERVEAKFENGVLTVTVHGAEEGKRRKIEI
jgi:HSP20 family protein